MKDVLVVGGGPAGCASAIILARSGVSVTMIDAPRPTSFFTTESLPPKISSLLRQLAAWSSFLASNPLESPGNLSIWGDEIPYETNFIFNPSGNGWHIDRNQFDEMLRNQVKKNGGKIIYGKVKNLVLSDQSWSANIQTFKGEKLYISASSIIWACGRNTSLPDVFSATRKKLDNLVAIAAYCSTNDFISKDYRSWTESTPNGWWYTSPAIRGKHFCAFFTEARFVPAHHRSLWWHQQREATKLIQNRVKYNLSDVKLKTVCAHSSLTSLVSGKSWRIVGDASLALDPLTSTGIYFALKSGMLAAEELLGLHPLGVYERWIQEQYKNYVLERTWIYQQEKRWKNASFWKSRTDELSFT